MLNYSRQKNSTRTLEPIGMIAAGGRLPVVFAHKAKSLGFPIVCLAIKDMADPELKDICDTHLFLRRFALSKIVRSFRKRNVHRWTMLGKFHKVSLLKPRLILRYLPDWRGFKFYFRHSRRDNKDDSLLLGLIEELSQDGLECIAPLELCPELLVRSGILTKREPTAHEWDDIRFGWYYAREMGRLDIGQSVMVKNKIIVAVEAIEGTDQAILRAGSLCGGSPFVVVKVAKPEQDQRFDVPTVGPQTIATMRQSGAKTLAIEAGATILLDEEAMLEAANAAGITIVALTQDEMFAPTTGS